MPEPAIKIEFPQEKLQALVEHWVIEQLSAEQKETILAQAIKYLMTPPPQNQYDRTPARSPIQVAFDQAVTQTIHKIAREMIENSPEVQAKCRQMIGEAVETFFTGTWDAPGSAFVAKVSEAFALWFTDSRS